MLKLTYLSHSCFMLEDGEYKLLIDPFITGNPNSPATLDNISADFIVVTHAHSDHLGDTVEIAKDHGSMVIAVNELANCLAEQGVNVHNMHIGGAWNFPFGKCKFTIAHHGSSTDDGKYMGEPAGVIIEMGGKTIYHAGDTGLFMDMKLIGELDDIDMFLTPIGDNFTMGINDAAKAVEFVNPELTIPMHYNTFPPIQVDPEEFKTKVEAIGKKARVMDFGESISFD